MLLLLQFLIGPQRLFRLLRCARASISPEKPVVGFGEIRLEPDCSLIARKGIASAPHFEIDISELELRIGVIRRKRHALLQESQRTLQIAVLKSAFSQKIIRPELPRMVLEISGSQRLYFRTPDRAGIHSPGQQA